MAKIPDEIERVALLGWAVYPASTRSRAACVRSPSAVATCGLDQIEHWCHDFPGCNWRCVAGPSQIWALDIDAPQTHANDGVSAMHALVEARGPLPPAPRIRTGGGGVTVVFRHDGEPIRGETGWPAPGIDPRRGALSITLPPSRHLVTRRLYRWLVAPWDVCPPPAPAWLLALVAPPPPRPIRAVERRDVTPERAWRRLCRAVERVASAPAGGRNATLNRASYSLGALVRDGALTEHEVDVALGTAAERAGLSRLEIGATIRSGLSAGARAL